MYLWLAGNGEIKVYCRTYTKVLIVARLEEREEILNTRGKDNT